MKNLIFVLLASSLFTLTDASMEGISKAIKKGDATALAQYFDADVEVTILDDVNILSKDEAKDALSSFFKSHKPNAYSQVHQGTSKGQGGQYSIGDMKTASEKFRVYIYLRIENNEHLIQEIRFEK